jgi:hypothetical protein
MKTNLHDAVRPERDSQSSDYTESDSEVSFVDGADNALSLSQTKTQLIAKMSYFVRRVNFQIASSCTCSCGPTLDRLQIADRCVCHCAHILDELQKSPTSVPIFRHKPAYRVVQSSLVKPLALHGSVCPNTLRPINFIVMHAPKDNGAGVSVAEFLCSNSFAEFICSNFDMSQCAMSLTVNEDHSLVFKGSDDTFSCLNKGRMHFFLHRLEVRWSVRCRELRSTCCED